MKAFSRARAALQLDNDALSAHRDGIRRNFSRIGAAVLLPFVLLHVAHGNWPMFGVNLVLAGVMLANAVALQRGRPPLVPFWLLCCAVLAGVCTSVLRQGMFGVLWAYPALFMYFFVLSRRMAMVLGTALLLGTSAACLATLGTPMAVRVFMSVGLILVMINVVLNVIGELQRALVEQAITDPLTGAFNRRHLQAHLGQRTAAIGVGAPSDALLAIDIDHFKHINDRHGHAAGDEVLRRLVATVAARTRSGDLLFRTGGEEFVLLLPRVTPAAARSVAEDLRLRLSQAELLPGETVTVSIGVSALVAGQSVDAWVKTADTALYEAKRTGRNRVVVAEGA